ncbi:hypothetical protein [Vibrio diabolicus]|uniref:hypothetical protein n=1 Tax=Vibrio diabolicus TaxID=50719 RepID=UPI00232D942E|nr:hypothetical protein [Vibrio diabolicus]
MISIFKAKNTQEPTKDNNSHVYNTLKLSGLFEEKYYREQSGISPELDAIQHYIDEGFKQGFNPSKEFDTDIYLKLHHDIDCNIINPFFHYIEYGRSENRQSIEEEFISDFATGALLPKPASQLCRCENKGVFCSEVYRASYQDLKELSLDDARSHFASFGINEHRFRHISKVYSYYSNLYSSELNDILNDSEQMIAFLRDKVEEEHLSEFLHFIFEPCSKEKSLYCFDIFDTLIYREVFNPEDIFSLVELQSQFWGFTQRRIEAETKCKNKFGIKQYLLDDIYEEMNLDKDLTSKLIDLELQTEKDNIKIRQSTIQFVDTLHRYGHDVQFISDFHLKKEDLLKILPDIFSEKYSDKLIVSGDVGDCKHSGELYKWYFRNYDLSQYANILMIGDNYHSDYVKANENSFTQAIRIPTINETKLRKYISIVASSDLIIKREIKKSAIEGNDIIVPVLAGCMIYISKYLESLKELNPSAKVFCLGRDGHLLKKSYKAIYGSDIAEVSNSRTLNFNAIVKTFDDLDACLNRDGYPTSIGNVLYNRLGYRINSKFSGLPDEVLKTSLGLKESVYHQVIPHCEIQRKAYQAYLGEQHNIVDGEKYIAFDIGYRGTSAKAFYSMLPQAEINWVYFATFSEMIFEHKYDAILNNVNTERYGEVLPILESLFSNEDIGSAHYFDDGKLLRKNLSSDSKLRDIVSSIQGEVVSLLNRYRQLNGHNLNLEYASRLNILEYLINPESSLARRFIGISNEDSFANATSYFISGDLDSNKSSWKSGLNSVLTSLNSEF